jgi:hypothetical protein
MPDQTVIDGVVARMKLAVPFNALQFAHQQQGDALLRLSGAFPFAGNRISGSA